MRIRVVHEGDNPDKPQEYDVTKIEIPTYGADPVEVLAQDGTLIIMEPSS